MTNGESGPECPIARYSDEHGGWGLRFTYRPGAGLCGDRPFINCISGGWIIVYETEGAAKREAERMLAETYGARDRYESVVPVRVERGQRQPSIAEEEEAEKIATIRSAYEATIHDLEAEVRRLREVEQAALTYLVAINFDRETRNDAWRASKAARSIERDVLLDASTDAIESMLEAEDALRALLAEQVDAVERSLAGDSPGSPRTDGG